MEVLRGNPEDATKRILFARVKVHGLPYHPPAPRILPSPPRFSLGFRVEVRN